MNKTPINEVELDITAQNLIDAGVQYGSKFQSLERSMSKYVYGVSQVFGPKNNLCILDLDKTLEKLKEVCNLLYGYGLQRNNVLLVGTRDFLRDLVEKISMETRVLLPNQTRLNGFYFIHKRFMPGLFTNFHTFLKKIQQNERYKQLTQQNHNISKNQRKNHSQIQKHIEKDDVFFKGVSNLHSLDDIKAVIVIGVNYEKQCVKEARKMNIPIIGLVDTDSDCSLCDYFIPCNDKSSNSIYLILKEIQKAYMKGLAASSKTVKKFEKSGFDRNDRYDKNSMHSKSSTVEHKKEEDTQEEVTEDISTPELNNTDLDTDNE